MFAFRATYNYSEKIGAAFRIYSLLLSILFQSSSESFPKAIQIPFPIEHFLIIKGCRRFPRENWTSFNLRKQASFFFAPAPSGVSREPGAKKDGCIRRLNIFWFGKWTTFNSFSVRLLQTRKQTCTQWYLLKPYLTAAHSAKIRLPVLACSKLAAVSHHKCHK